MGFGTLNSQKTKPGVRMNRLCKSLVVLEVVAAGLMGVATGASAAEALKPDANKGQAIATSVCVACHGADGNSASAAFPKLAGQHEQYLLKELKDFKVKPGEKAAVRQNPVMAGIVASLSDQDMANVAAYFASLPGAGTAAKSEFMPHVAKIGRASCRERV